MAVLDKVKVMLQNILEEFVKQVSTDKGLLQYDADELEVGVKVSIIDEEGNATPAEDGQYKLDDGRSLVIEGGEIKEIDEAEDNQDGEDDTAEEQFSSQEETVEETVEVEAQEQQEEVVEETEAKQRFNKIKEVFEASYQEKEAKIIEAIRGKGFDCWLVEAADDYAIVEVWVMEKDEYIHYRFPITWEGEDAVVGDPEEVVKEYVPVNDEAKVVEEVFSKQEKEQLESEIETLKARISELENTPAGKPAKQQFRNTVKTTDNEKLDNFINKYCSKN